MAPIQKRQLGLWRTTSLVIGNMVGSGIFLLPASLGIYGAIGLFGWIFTAFGAICLALVFARLSHNFPRIGGPYAYSREAFGDFIGFQMAWSYWVANWVSNAAVSIAFVSYLSIFFPTLNAEPTHALLLAISTVWLLTFINIKGAGSAGIVQVIATVLKIIPLVAIGVLGIFHLNMDHFIPFNPTQQPTFSVINTTATLTLFAFLGLESATVPAEAVENPKKTIPRATIIGTVLAAIIYIWTMVVILGILSPAELARSSAPFADAGRVIFGEWSVPIIAASAAISAFGTLNGWIMLQGQMPLAAARDGLFPKLFEKVTRNGTPIFGLILSSILITVLLAMNYEASLVEQFTVIVNFTTFAILLPYLYSSVADLMLLFTRPNSLSKKRMIRSAVIAGLAFVYSLWAIAGSGQEIVYLGTLFILAGIPIYVIMKMKSEKSLN
jgi:APA family basic amino acid/polyamine antiporter